MQPHEILARAVDEQGRRQAWIAERMGVSESTVSLWLAGKRELPEARRLEMAALLGVAEEATK